MSNYKDLKNNKFSTDTSDFSDIVDTGTEGTKVAVGTTAQRGSTTGQLRFNSTTGLAEYYDGAGFKAIDAAPQVSSVNTANFESSALPTNVVITGAGFSSTVTVKFIGNDATEIASPSVTRDSSTQVTAQIPATVTSANEPWDIRVTNASSLNGTLEDAFNIDAAPVFVVASGTLGTLENADRAGSNLTNITTTDDESDTVTYSVTTGSVPAGLTLASNGTWSGTATAVGSNTTTTFTVTANDGTNTSTRQYTVTVNAPVIVQLSGSGTWSRPAGLSASSVVALLVVAGGGGAGGSRTSDPSGGGGAGGLVYITNFITASSSYSYSIGGGGSGGQSGTSYGSNGSDTTFTNITAKGGGGGGGTTYGSAVHGNAGGSGGGSGSYNGNGGSSNQTASFTVDSTTYSNVGFGNSGSGGNGGAGGGAGGAASGNTGGVGKDVSASFGTSYGVSGVFAKGGSDGGNAHGAGATGDGASSQFNTAPNKNGGSGTIIISY